MKISNLVGCTVDHTVEYILRDIIKTLIYEQLVLNVFPCEECMSKQVLDKYVSFRFICEQKNLVLIHCLSRIL